MKKKHLFVRSPLTYDRETLIDWALGFIQYFLEVHKLGHLHIERKEELPIVVSGYLSTKSNGFSVPIGYAFQANGQATVYAGDIGYTGSWASILEHILDALVREVELQDKPFRLEVAVHEAVPREPIPPPTQLNVGGGFLFRF